jgi:hypothetical protein
MYNFFGAVPIHLDFTQELNKIYETQIFGMRYCKFISREFEGNFVDFHILFKDVFLVMFLAQT